MSCLSGGGNNGSAQKKQKLSSSPSAHQQQLHHSHSYSSSSSSCSPSNTQHHSTTSPPYTRSSQAASPNDIMAINATKSGQSNVYINGYAQQSGRGGGGGAGASSSQSHPHQHHQAGSASNRLHTSSVTGALTNGIGAHSQTSSSRVSPQHSRVPTNSGASNAKANATTTINSVTSPGGNSPASIAPPQDYPLGNSVSCFDMCVYCFDVLINRLKPSEVPRVTSPSFAHANDSL